MIQLEFLGCGVSQHHRQEIEESVADGVEDHVSSRILKLISQQEYCQTQQTFYNTGSSQQTQDGGEGSGQGVDQLVADSLLAAAALRLRAVCSGRCEMADVVDRVKYIRHVVSNYHLILAAALDNRHDAVRGL